MGGEARFTMLETLREYALERLAASGESATRGVLTPPIALSSPKKAIRSSPRAEREAWLSRCDVEEDNFRAALDWLVESGDTELALRLGLALFWFWERREHLVEGRQRLLAILELGTGESRTAEWAMATIVRRHALVVPG